MPRERFAPFLLTRPGDRPMQAMAKTTSAGVSLTWSGAEIPSLYGLRGIAALTVVLAHLGLSAFNGNYSVICFFVLSGFLITHLLLKEFDKTGNISLRQFYLRRALRIFPAFYGYAACYVLGDVAFLPDIYEQLLLCFRRPSSCHHDSRVVASRRGTVLSDLALHRMATRCEPPFDDEGACGDDSCRLELPLGRSTP